MSTMPTSERFSILKNGVDDRLEIIRDNETGFYNITKTAKMIKDLMESENVGHPTSSFECQTTGENKRNCHENEKSEIPDFSSKCQTTGENKRNSTENEDGGIRPDPNKFENDSKMQNNEALGIRSASSKCQNPDHWFRIASTTTLINKCKEITRLDEVNYTLKKGISKPFHGIYVHKKLYDHFLIWLDPTYAMLVSEILDNIHQVENRKLLQEKDNAITQLKQAIQKQSEEAKIRDEAARLRDEAQSAEIQKLLAYAQNTSENLSEVKQELSEARLDIQENGIEIDRLNDKVDECRDVIIDRMEDHTLNPKSITKLQYFMCLQHPENDNELYAIRSQKPHIKKQLKAHHDWKVLIEPIEDPNSIKMFNRFKDRVKEIETSWKLEIKLRYKKGKINRESRDSKLEFIRENPLITINRNDIEFDIHRINLTQIIQLMQDTAFERFKLDVP